MFSSFLAVITAYAFVVDANSLPDFAGQSILMRGDNVSAIYWCNRCRGAREPRSGALMRVLGCREMRSDRCFRARHVKGVTNSLADGISRWDKNSIAINLRSLRPDVH